MARKNRVEIEFLADINGFNQAVKEARKLVADLGADLKSAFANVTVPDFSQTTKKLEEYKNSLKETALAHKELEAATQKLDAALTKLDGEAKKIEEDLKKTDEAAKKTAREFDKVDKSTTDGAKSVDKFDKSLSATSVVLGAATIGLASFAVSGSKLITTFIGAAERLQNYKASLVALAGSQSAATAELEKFKAISAKSSFNLNDIIAAAVRIKALGANVDEILPLARDLAAVFNGDVVQAASALAKVSVGSANGLRVLSNTFGISRTELIKFGAKAKGTQGAISLLGDGARRTTDAFKKLSVVRGFTGADSRRVETFAGQFSLVKDAVEKLSASIGQELAPTIIPLIQYITSAVEAIGKFPKPLKQAAAFLTLFGTGIAGIAGTLASLGFVLNLIPGAIGPILKLLQTQIGFTGEATIANQALAESESEVALAEVAVADGAAGAVTGLEATTVAAGEAATATGALGLSLAGFAAAATGIGVVVGAVGFLIIKLMEADTAAKELKLELGQKLFNKTKLSQKGFEQFGNAMEEVRTKGLKSANDIADALVSSGLKADDIAKKRLQLVDQRKKLNEKLAQQVKDNAQLESDAQKELLPFVKRREEAELKAGKSREAATRKTLENTKLLISALSIATEGANKNTKAFEALQAQQESALAEFTDFQAKTSDGLFSDPKQELDALDSIINKLDNTSKEFQKADRTRQKLAKKVSKFEKDEAISAIDFQLAKEEAAGTATVKTRLAAVKKKLKVANLEKRERQSLLVEEIKLTKDAEDEKTRLAREGAAARAEAEKIRLDASISASDEEIASIRSSIDAGKDKFAQLNKELAKRRELTKAAAQQTAEDQRGAARTKFAQDVKKDPGNRKALQEKLNAQLAAIDSELQTKISAIDRQGAEERKKIAEEESKRKLEIARETAAVVLQELQQSIEQQKSILEQKISALKSADAPSDKIKQSRIDLANFENKSNNDLIAAKEKILDLETKINLIGKSTAEQSIIRRKEAVSLNKIISEGAKKGAEFNKILFGGNKTATSKRPESKTSNETSRAKRSKSESGATKNIQTGSSNKPKTPFGETFKFGSAKDVFGPSTLGTGADNSGNFEPNIFGQSGSKNGKSPNRPSSQDRSQEIIAVLQNILTQMITLNQNFAAIVKTKTTNPRAGSDSDIVQLQPPIREGAA